MSEIRTIDSLKSLDKTIYSITGRIQLNKINGANTDLLLDIGDFNVMTFTRKLRKEYSLICNTEILKNQFKDELKVRLQLIKDILDFGSENLCILKEKQTEPTNDTEIIELFNDVITNAQNSTEEKIERYNSYCANGDSSNPFMKILSQCMQWRIVGQIIDAFIHMNFNEVSRNITDLNPTNNFEEPTSDKEEYKLKGEKFFNNVFINKKSQVFCNALIDKFECKEDSTTCFSYIYRQMKINELIHETANNKSFISYAETKSYTGSQLKTMDNIARSSEYHDKYKSAYNSFYKNKG